MASQSEKESAVIIELYKHGIDGVSGMVALPPTRALTEDGVRQAISTYNIDGILLIAEQGRFSTTAYIPGQTTTRGTATLIGNQVNYSERSYQTGGFYISKPHVYHTLTMIDTKTGTISWTASTSTNGNAFAGNRDLVKSLSESIVNTLARDNLIP